MSTPIITRRTDREYQSCAEAGDAVQPCNHEGATYTTQRPGGRARPLCANHAARLAAQHGITFPIARTP